MRRYRSLEERLCLYKEVMRLKKQGLGYKRIAKTLKEKYGVSLNPGMICNWITGRYHPLGSCNKLITGPELAYVIGGWLGDGTLAFEEPRYKYYVKLSVKDYEFAEEWGRCLAKASGKTKLYRPRWDKRNQRWTARGSNILLYHILKRVKVTENPWILLSHLKPYPVGTLRGLFDAEGSVNPRWYEIGFTNTNSEITRLTQWLLRGLSIESKIYPHNMEKFLKDPQSGKVYQRRRTITYDLKIRGRRNIVRFAESVRFTIVRKQENLRELRRRYKTPASFPLHL